MVSKKVSVKLVMDPEQKARIATEAERRGLSLSAFMRSAALAECEKRKGHNDQ